MKSVWTWLITALVVAVIVVAGIVAFVAVAGGKGIIPLKMVLRNSYWRVLAADAATLDDCASCHKAEDTHTCETCHDEHGAVELAGVPFDNLLRLAGDVPEPGYIPISQILPYREGPQTMIPLLDFLAERGVVDFLSVTLLTDDGGFVTMARDQLTPDAMLMPHVDGVRFAAENLHVSTWMKGIRQILVAGRETPITIEGELTSIGRLLLGTTVRVTVEPADVMLKSPMDGQIRKATTAARLEGVPIEALLHAPDFTTLSVRDTQGHVHSLKADDARGAILAQLWGKAVLVLPERGRGQWIEDVVEIDAEP